MSSKKKSGGRMGLVVQAICAAEANITLAKQMLAEMHGGQLPGVSGKMAAAPVQKDSFKEKPGITGTFDGEYMITEEGKKYEVNKNYASKSMLIYGDTLKMIEERDRNFFKQIDRVKRRRVEGVLVKKDGKWCLVTSDGSYRLLDEAISFHRGEEGKEAVGIIPQDNLKAPFAALEKVVGVGEEKPAKGREEKKAPEKKVEKKEEKVMEKKETKKVIKPTAKKTTAKKESAAKKAVKAVEKKETKSATAKSSKASEAPGKDELR